MKLEEALPLLRAGKKVGRTPHYYLEIQGREVLLISGTCHSFDDEWAAIDSEDFLADDWEVVE